MTVQIDNTFDATTHTLTADWPHGGTVSISYPTGRGPADYASSHLHRIITQTVDALYAENGTADFSFRASTIVITNMTGRTIGSGVKLFLELDRAGRDLSGDPAAVSGMTELRLFNIALGAPIAADADSAVQSQACSATTGLATGFNGVRSAGLTGPVTFDVPRNVVAAWTTTAILTVTGTDETGEDLVEISASGTSLTGKKAFKTITGVAVSANVTGLTVGHGDVLGLPVALERAADVRVELEDGAAASAGTIVAAVATAATGTTGDVRGTYDPNSACNGSKRFDLVVMLKSAGYKGVPQYGG